MKEDVTFIFSEKINNIPSKLVPLVRWRMRANKNALADLIISIARGEV